MTRNEKAPIERDLKRDVWLETLNAIKDIKAGKVGAVRIVEIPAVVEARTKAGLFKPSSLSF